MAIGAGAGVVLRLVFTVAIAWLFQLPYLKLVGGLVLLYIGAKLLVDEGAEKKEMEAAAQLWRAVWIVVVADVVMSFDNILAMVEIADSDLLLLAIAWWWSKWQWTGLTGSVDIDCRLGLSGKQI